MKKNAIKEVWVAMPALGSTDGIGAYAHMTVEQKTGGFRFVQRIALAQQSRCNWQTMVTSFRPTEAQAVDCLEEALRGFLEYRHGTLLEEDPVEKHNNALKKNGGR